MAHSPTHLRHPLTGAVIRPVGYRRNGTPIWPIMGASEPPAPPANPPAPPNNPPPANPPANPPQPPDQPVPPKPDDKGFPENTPVAEMTVDQQAAYWKFQARKHEQTAKSRGDYDQLKQAAAELEQLKAAQLTDDQKAVKEAEARGRQTATTEFAQQLAAAKIEAALAGLVDNPAEITEDLNLARFVTTDGKVDTDAVTKLREKYAAMAPNNPARPDFGQGRRGTGSSGTEQLTSADLARMTPEQIVAARRDGKLTNLGFGPATTV